MNKKTLLNLTIGFVAGIIWAKSKSDPEKEFERKYEYHQFANTREIQKHIIGSRRDAIDILAALEEIATNYGPVNIAEYYDLIGEMPSYLDNEYGWTLDDIHRTVITAVKRGGYMLHFPPTRHI